MWKLKNYLKPYWKAAALAPLFMLLEVAMDLLQPWLMASMINEGVKQLGFVLQDAYVFSDTILENIRYGRLEASDEEVMAAAVLAQADDFIRTLPDGYHTMLSAEGTNLSQGQRQLITIARAILSDPAILILDEATSSIDTQTEAAIQQAMKTLMQGRTSFVIAHRLSTIREADLILYVNNGRIVESGTHQQLLDNRSYYYELYQNQFRKRTGSVSNVY